MANDWNVAPENEEFFLAIANAKESLGKMSQSIEAMKGHVKVIRESDLKRRGPQAELKWRLNRFWRDGFHPGEPVNWKGERGMIQK